MGREIKESSGQPLNDIVSRSEAKPLAQALGHVHDDVLEGTELEAEHAGGFRAVGIIVFLGALFERPRLSERHVRQIREVLVKDLQSVGGSVNGSMRNPSGRELDKTREQLHARRSSLEESSSC